MPRFYYIVPRGEWGLYDLLRRDFVGEPAVDVIIDRRFRERRQAEAPVATERRRRDRRRGDRDVAEQLLDRGYAIAERDG